MSKVLEIIEYVNGIVNDFVWGVPILVLILATGLYFTIRLGFFQFTHFGFLFRDTIVKAFKKKDEEKPAKGELTSFQAAMTSVSAIVGSGNIAGVATAIVVGGPGALFWMIIAAIFGMASKFAEITLGIKYRQFNEDGTVRGGAMYYLADGLKQKWLGILFSILVIPFAFVISGIVDTNTIATTLFDEFRIPTIATGIFLAVVTGIIVFGGAKRVGYVCAVIAPFMGGAYLLAGLFIIILNIGQLPSALGTIIKAAFNPSAATGGIIGSIFVTMKMGVARGMYSNEAGLGTAAMVHSPAKVDTPSEQGVWGPIEVFLDTIVVCTITALAIVMSGLWSQGSVVDGEWVPLFDGATLTVNAFKVMLPGNVGYWIAIGSVILFGFSCLISYFDYATQAAEYLFGEKSKIVIKILWVVAIVVGSQTTLGFVWDLADTFNGLMIIPNLIGILILSNEVVKEKKAYFEANGMK